MRREVRKTIPWVLAAAGAAAVINLAMGIASGVKPVPMAIFAVCWGVLLSLVIVAGVYAGMISGLLAGIAAGAAAGLASGRVIGSDGPALEIYVLIAALLGLLAGIASHWYGRRQENPVSPEPSGTVMRRWKGKGEQ